MGRLPPHHASSHSPHPPTLDPHRPVRFLGQLLDPPYHPPAHHHIRHGHRDTLAPDFDVRESDDAYFLEGELPGVSDKDGVKLEWIDRRTLSIDARIERVNLEAEWGVLGHCGGVRKEQQQQQQQQQQQHSPPAEEPISPPSQQGSASPPAAVPEPGQQHHVWQPVASPQPVQPVVKDWLAERRVGHYQRTFTFPADVDASMARARLGMGLMRILVPKVRGVEGNRSQPVVIEGCE